jgi:hypothetical protein
MLGVLYVSHVPSPRTTLAPSSCASGHAGLLVVHQFSSSIQVNSCLVQPRSHAYAMSQEICVE